MNHYALISQPQPPHCSRCENNNNGAFVFCVKCHKLFHQSCAYTVPDSSFQVWKCLNCIELASASSVRSISSRTSNSTNQLAELELQRLEEERQMAIARDQEFLDKKYKILETHNLNNSHLHKKSLEDSIATESIYFDTLAGNVEPNFINDSPTSLPNDYDIEQFRQNERPNMSLFAIQTTATVQPTNSVLTCAPTMSTNAASVAALPAARAQQSNSALMCATTTSTQAATAAAHTAATAQRIQFLPSPTIAAQPSLTSTFVNSVPTCVPITSSLFTSTHTNAQPNPAYSLSNNLSSVQISARQSVPKELPTFSGQPEEWPLFSSTFEWSTTVCGLTDAENLIRLQRSLRGEALHAVRHILIHPSCVSSAMSTLKLLYGQPEKILNSIKNRLKLLPQVNQNKLETFTFFAIGVKNLQTTIEACGLHDEMNNSSLLQDLVEKLPPFYQISWGTHKLDLARTNMRPNLAEFANWIYNFGLSASTIVSTNSVSNEKTAVRKNDNQRGFIHLHNEQNRKDSKSCCVCKKFCNNVANCKMFQSLDRGEKWKIIRKFNLCKQCLQQHAYFGSCAEVCGVDRCQLKHHALLHRNIVFKQNPNSPQLKTSELGDIEKHKCNTHYSQRGEIVFKIIPVALKGKNDKIVNTFAFIDEGSSISLLDEEIANELQLSGQSHALCLKWTGEIQREEQFSRKLNVEILINQAKKIKVNVHTVSNLSLPIQTLNVTALCKRFKHLRNIPIKGYENAMPRLLIGLDNWKLGIPHKIQEGKSTEPVAIKTTLGWLIYGACSSNQNFNASYNFHICECTSDGDAKLQEMVKTFYSLENIGVNLSSQLKASSEDERCLNMLKRLTRKRSDGHYETGLLWRYDNFEIPNSYDMAKKRLLCLEKKLNADPQLLSIFIKTISDYLAKGYIRKLDNHEEANEKVWYLPIFAVFNKNKPGKTRIVWDAASKANGVSLNSLLLKGPDLLENLTGILQRFRQKSVAVCGDIAEMFHQIFIRSEDQHVQRFLWRGCNANIEPEIYIMNVMIFGATCAPNISQYVKNLNASEFENEFPQAASTIRRNHYVDDYLDSFDTIEEAIKITKQVKFVHSQGGFYIRNWTSNADEVLQEVNTEMQATSKSLSLGSDPSMEKVLGIFWMPNDDMITFRVSTTKSESDIFIGDRPPTKREVLRAVMSIYDPLGLLGHFIMYAKILMQEIWRSAVAWDEPILPAQFSRWLDWVKLLPDLENIRINRCYLKCYANYNLLDVQLHTFVDAGENGCAAVSYFRITDGEDIVCSLIGSRTKVAPLKLTSIPRLELMAALIGARFGNHILQNHTLQVSRKVYWSDSKTVLSWLHSDHRKYSQFVGFRVSEILDLTDPNEWRWIPSKLNVADEATKWVSKIGLHNEGRWFSGPQLLYMSEAEWPTDAHSTMETTEEIKRRLLHIDVVVEAIDVKRFSKWTRVVRTTAFALRFIENMKSKVRGQKIQRGEIIQDEIIKAENVLYRQAQMSMYAEEISMLKNNKPLSKASSIYKISPYLDQNNILRIDGRIDMACVTSEQKRPIILPKENPVTTLIIMHYHNFYRHLNHETAINEIRQLYYIARLRVVYKKQIRNCQMCKIQNAVPLMPQMAKLPRARLAAHVAPFTFTGLDFFGPILITINRHKEKRYGVLFTCLTIRAVHIEIAYSLNTNSCILAIRNFMARRGIPREFFSDNGTNFIGAERKLREAVAEVDRNELVRTFTSSYTKWNFNPPLAPHMGGAWERLVRSIKTVFYKITPTRSPNEELLRSMMAEVENIVNSRPLTYVPLDDSNAEAITPNHILLGSSSGMKPYALLDNSADVLKSSWLESQRFADMFWKRWLIEYLPSLTCRTKWHEKVKPLCTGDLVIVVDSSCPRNVWPRGMYDGNVAVYNLKENFREPLYVSSGINAKHAACVWEIKWGPDMADGEINFYSISSDGRVFNWILMQNKLSITVIITLFLENDIVEGPDGTEVCLKSCGSCMKFHPTDHEIFLIGTEEGCIYKCSIAYSSKYLMTYYAHNLSVYRIDFNRFNSNIFVSCSGDWRVKIWEDMRAEPLFIFDLGSSVGDVKWAPYSSTIFAAVTNEGKVFVFDLNINKYRAICVQAVVPKRKNKLTRLAFNENLPFIVVGDDKGTTTSLKLSPNLRLMVKPPKKQMYLDQNTLQVQKLDKLLSLVRELPEGSIIKDTTTTVQS